MNTTKLYIENQLVELSEEIQFLINRQFEDITNPTVIINDWSKTVEIPATQINDEIFGHIYSPDKIIVDEEDPSILIKDTYNQLKTLIWQPSVSETYYTTTFDSGNQYASVRIQGSESSPGGSFDSFTVYTGKIPSSTPYDELDDERIIKSNVQSGTVQFTFTAREGENAIKLKMNGGSNYYPIVVIGQDVNYTTFEEGKKYTVTITFNNTTWGSAADIDVDFTIKLNQIEYDYKRFGVYFDPYKKLNFRLEWNDSVVMEGYAKMNEIIRKDTKTTYNLTLNGSLGKVFQEMKKITFDKSIYNSTGTTDEEKKYVIQGWNYCQDTMSRYLVYDCFTTGARPERYKKIEDAVGETEQIIGFLLNNGFSDDFDYKSYVSNDGGYEVNHLFEDTLPETFPSTTGVNRSTVIGDGLKPRDIGEFRSYNQLPFYWWDMFWQIFQKKAEELTGYEWDYTDDWFSSDNPYWRAWILKVRDFPLVPTEEQSVASNIYTIRSLTPRYYQSNPLFWGIYYQSTTTNNWNNSAACSVYMKDSDVELPVYAVGTNAYNSYFQFVDGADIITIPQYNLVLNTPRPISSAPITQYPGSSHTFRWQAGSGYGGRLKIDYQFLDANTNDVVKTITYYAYSNIDKSEPDGVYDIIVDGTPQTYDVTLYDNTTTIRYWTIPIPSYKISRNDIPSTSFRINMIFTWETLDGYSERNGFKVNGNVYDEVIELNLLQDMSNTVTYQEVDLESYAYYRSNTVFDYNDLWNNDYNPFDFILNYCKMFRIGIYTDNINKKLIFKPIHKYLAEGDNTTDWTDKVDYNKDFNIVPISWENQYIKFNYEDNDIRDNIRYNKEFGFNYGEKQIRTDYNFNNETQNLFENVGCGITYTPYVVSWSNLFNEQKIVFTVPNEMYLENIDEDNKEIDLFGIQGFVAGLELFDTTSNLRECYITDDSNLEVRSDIYCYNQTGSNRLRTYTHSPYKISFSPVTGTNLFATFSVPSRYYGVKTPSGTNYDIYTLFWKRYIEERYNKNNKKVTCYVDISPEEFQQFDFNKFVKINNQLYFVNRIFDFNLTGGETTKVELITIQNPSAYRTDLFSEIME